MTGKNIFDEMDKYDLVIPLILGPLLANVLYKDWFLEGNILVSALSGGIPKMINIIELTSMPSTINLRGPNFGTWYCVFL